MYSSCFAFGDSETVCVCSMGNFPDKLLQLALGSSIIFWSGSDAEVVNIEVILNSRSETLFYAVYFYIEPCHWQNTPSGNSFFLLVEIRKGWSDLDSEFPVREKLLYEVGQSASQLHAMQVFHCSKPPGGVISFLQINESY